MKKKINAQFIIIGIFAVLATLVLSILVCYGIFKKQIIDDLRGYAQIIIESDAEVQNLVEHVASDNVRITVIGSDGQVLYENEAKHDIMDNHSNRPEVIEARKNGEGSDVRISSTLSRNTFYYAVLLENGDVLRTAKDAYSIYVIFINAVPLLMIIAAVIIVICAVLAHYLTLNLVEPIEKMAEELDNTNSSKVYKELVPIFEAIKENHKKTISNAKMRQEFTANVSHELKTPLTAISGYAELIESGMANEEDITRFSGEIHKNANRLLTLINDTIKLSELDDMTTGDELEELDLYQVVNDCKEMLSVNANKHNIKITFSGSSCKVRANKNKMEEILYNLCDNAIRYNNEGGSVFVSVYEEKDRKVLSVKDTGIGIPKEHQERIFERFYRVDKSRSKSTGGTGLGLAIVKHMVARQGAGLELESESGRGTEIRVVFHA